MKTTKNTFKNCPDWLITKWQEIADLLAKLLNIPAALIMKTENELMEVFLSGKSENNPYHVGYKEKWYGLYCETVIRTQAELFVPNALADVKWKNNPDIELNMISYLGFPILLPDKKPFGTICILDRKENFHSKSVEGLISKFRDLIQADIEILYMNQALGDENKKLSDYLVELHALRGIVPICANCKSIRDHEGNWNPIEHYFKYQEARFSHGMCPDCAKKFFPE